MMRKLVPSFVALGLISYACSGGDSGTQQPGTGGGNNAGTGGSHAGTGGQTNTGGTSSGGSDGSGGDPGSGGSTGTGGTEDPDSGSGTGGSTGAGGSSSGTGGSAPAGACKGGYPNMCPAPYETGATLAEKCDLYCKCMGETRTAPEGDPKVCTSLSEVKTALGSDCKATCMSKASVWELCCRIDKCLQHKCVYKDQATGACWAAVGINACVDKE